MNSSKYVCSPWFRAFAFATSLLFAIGFSNSVTAAIAFDAASSTSGVSLSSTSWSHTVGTGSDRVLIVGIALEDTSTADLTVSSVTYNGVAMTAVPNSIATDGSSTFNRTQLFYQLSPASGTHTVAIAFGGSVNGVNVGAVSLSGVNAAAPAAAATSILDSGTALSASINVATANSWLVDVVSSGAASAAFTAGSGQTSRWSNSQSNSSGAASTKSVATTGTATTSWTCSNSSRLALSALALAPSSTAATAPTITTQPASQTVTAGSSVTFSVVASGTSPFTYQWKFNGTAISGATSTSYTIASAQSANAGSYTVTVTNTAGSATSNAATLTVNAVATAPTITTQPASQTVTAGSSVTFSVAASGTSPLTYQWKFNGTAISGATNASYTIASTQSSDAGSNTVTVTNSAGSATSNAATLTVNASSGGGLIYVSPTGTDSNPGTLAAPTTLTMAISEALPGDTIYLRGGTYSYSATITIATGNNGTSSATKKIFAYNGEVPVLNWAAQATADANRGLQLFGNYWYLKGLTIEHAGDNGLFVGGNNNIVELCITRYNRDSGLQISRSSSSFTDISQWPSNNLILNCDSYDNADPGAENADGFACKLTAGPGNIFRGCISHNNIDDGWDLYAKTDTGAIGPVLIENCVSYNNGALSNGSSSGSGDKNGFKLGGSGVAVQHTIRRSIAFGNGHHGFTDNDNPGPITVTNNTGFNNANSNFNFRSGGSSVFTNNASLNAGSSDATYSTLTGTTNLFWVSGASNNNGGTKVISSADFQNLTAPTGGFTRNTDGSINLGTFAKLVSGSDLVNGGTPSGTDIGAVESF